MTIIEQELFRNKSAHWVAGFEYHGDTIIMLLHPCNREDLKTNAKFTSVKIKYFDDSYNEDGLDFPWDIIGFDCKAVDEKRWEFCMHTDKIEYAFESDWPVVKYEN